jgi:hypothetical protein
MLRADAAAVHFVIGVLGASVLIPPNIAAHWYEFVAEWCLGIEPQETPSEVERAFDALRRLWPEFLNELEVQGAQGHRGISMVISAVARGRTLAACERLDGFDPVMARLRRGEKAAMAELQFAEALVRCTFSPVLEPQLGSKKPDCLVRIGSKRLYAEVIAPEQAAAVKEAGATLQRMARELVERTTGTRTEILLSEEPGARFDAILTAVTSTLPDGRVHDIEEIAKVRRDFLGLLPPNVGPLINDLDQRPKIGVASARVGGGAISTSVTVRQTITSARVHRLLSNELSHFSKTERNILAVRVTAVEGHMKGWVTLVLRWLQPKRNRRVGAVILFDSGALMGPPFTIRQRWRVIENPYAYVSIPRSLINAISALDEGAP